MKTDTSNWLLEHYQAAYQFQSERTDTVRDQVSKFSHLLTLLGGAIIYTSINYPHSWREGWSLLFYGPIGISLILFVVAIGQVLYCLGWGFQYSYILNPRELQNYADKLNAYAEAHPEKRLMSFLASKTT